MHSLKSVSLVSLAIMSIVSCGPRSNTNQAESVQNVPISEGMENLGLAGVANPVCRLNYSLVKKGTDGKFSVVRDDIKTEGKPKAVFGLGCLNYCTESFQDLMKESRADGMQILVRSCQFAEGAPAKPPVAAPRLVSVPKEPVIEFVDSDGKGGVLGGTIKIIKAKDEKYFSHYVLYWGREKEGNETSFVAKLKVMVNNCDGFGRCSLSETNETLKPFATIAKTGGDVFFNLPLDTAIPLGATHILLATDNEFFGLGHHGTLKIIDDKRSMPPSD